MAFFVYMLASRRNGTRKLQLIEGENPEWEDLFDRVSATW